MHNGFDAVFNENSRVLILGSFPSVKSREAKFYYGHPQNRFWKTLSTIFNETIENSISQKTMFLLKHNIALFDVVKQSDLKGSADLDLQKSTHEMADLNFLLPPRTNIEKILCNGQTAYSLFTKNYKTTIPVICMPSTSSANPRFSIAKWQNELSFLKNNH